MHNKDNAWLLDCLILALLAFLGFCTYGLSSLMTPDEGRYAEIAREMLVHSQYIVPHLDSLVYFEKPPLVYWLTALSLNWFGFSEWAARFWPMAFSVVGMFYTYFVISKVYYRKLGFYTAVILGSSFLYLIQGHDLTLDYAVAFFINCALLTFWLCIHCYWEQKSTRLVLLVIAYLLVGLAVMSKGLIGFVFAFCILGLWLVINKKWRMIIELQPIIGIMIVVVISLPWMLLAQSRYPDFLHYYIWVQQFERYLTPIASRSGNRKFYVFLLLAMVFPWTAFWWEIFANIKTLAIKYSFFIIWAGFIIVFFAFSHSLLIPYLLPIVLPIAFLIAVCFEKIEMQLVKERKILYSLQFIVMLIAALAMITIGILHAHKHAGVLAPGILFTLMFLWLIYAYFTNMHYRKCFCVLVILFLLAQDLIFMNMDVFARRSLKQISLYMKTTYAQNPNLKLFVLFDYYQDVPYYYGHPIGVVTVNGLPSDLIYTPTYMKQKHATIVSFADFRKDWQTEAAYAIVRDKRIDMLEHLYPKIHFCKIALENRYALISNAKTCPQQVTQYP